ncbi:MAG: HEAT repeat domain-containing protein [Cyanobacteria bacterium J083]|nr:MAG: HEAT repeat domain-containing protein [Cyanobacteria bacterium J083]
MAINPDSVKQLLDSEDFGDRIRGINQLRHLDPQVAFELVKPLVKDPNTRVRYAAVSQFDTIGHENLAESLAILKDVLYNDPEPDVQAAAADAIGGLKLTEAYDDLAKVYHQTNEWLIQFSIIACLGELGEPRAFELLREALTEENELIKTCAISALGELGDRRAIPLLSQFINDPDSQIRYRLAQSLGHLGGEEAQTLLQQLAKDKNEQVAQAAKSQLN